MRQSQSQHYRGGLPESLDNSKQVFTPDQPQLFDREKPSQGSLNDEQVVRGIVTEVIRKSNKSREQIAEEMSQLTGDKVTVRMLNSYTSEAAEQHRWPLQYTRAFCHVLGDWSLLRCIVEGAGFHLISDQEFELLKIGRAYLQQKQAAETIAILEKSFRGGSL